MKKLTLLLAFGLLLSTGVMAQRIASVDVALILEKLPEYQEAQTALDQQAATWKREIDEEYDKIKQAYNKFQADQVLLSPEQKKAREDEIIAMETAARQKQRKRFGPEGDLFQKRQQLVRPIQDRVYEAIESYANDRGYDFIFDASGSAGIIFNNQQYDKTDDILSRLD